MKRRSFFRILPILATSPLLLASIKTKEEIILKLPPGVYTSVQHTPFLDQCGISYTIEDTVWGQALRIPHPLITKAIIGKPLPR